MNNGCIVWKVEFGDPEWVASKGTEELPLALAGRKHWVLKQNDVTDSESAKGHKGIIGARDLVSSIIALGGDDTRGCRLSSSRGRYLSDVVLWWRQVEETWRLAAKHGSKW